MFSHSITIFPKTHTMWGYAYDQHKDVLISMRFGREKTLSRRSSYTIYGKQVRHDQIRYFAKQIQEIAARTAAHGSPQSSVMKSAAEFVQPCLPKQPKEIQEVVAKTDVALVNADGDLIHDTLIIFKRDGDEVENDVVYSGNNLSFVLNDYDINEAIMIPITWEPSKRYRVTRKLEVGVLAE